MPKNWELPTAAGDKSYENLIQNYGFQGGAAESIDALISKPLYFTRTGNANPGNRNLPFGSQICYPTKKAGDDAELVTSFDIYKRDSDNYIRTNVDYARNVGQPVRCIAK